MLIGVRNCNYGSYATPWNNLRCLIFCKFNMDTACVELQYVSGSMIATDTAAVENDLPDNMYERSKPEVSDIQCAVGTRRLNFKW